MAGDGGLGLQVEAVEGIGAEVADEDVGGGEQLFQMLPVTGLSRSRTTLRLPRLSSEKAGLGMSLSMPNDPNTRRIGSPAGGSTLMTSAPQSAKSAAAEGAATQTPSSTTRRSASVESPDAVSALTGRPRSEAGRPALAAGP